MSEAQNLKDKESFPFIEEKFDSSFNCSSENKSEYSFSIIIIDDDRSEEESERNKTIFSIQKFESFLNECCMQWLRSKVGHSIKLKLVEPDDDPSKSPLGAVTVHYKFFVFGLHFLLFLVFCEILHRWGLAFE